MINTNQTKSKLKDFSNNNLGKLYIVATPIGNMGDITIRAIEVLKSVSLILCEDTRLSSNLLSKLGIKNKLGIYNDQSEGKDKTKIIKTLQSGESVALISDAGTPLISDPGYKLVEEIKSMGFDVVPIPGPSAVITALCASGLPTDSFYFAGFLPTTLGKLKSHLESLKAIKTTIVAYESPNRLLKTLEMIAEVFGDIQISVAREITKLHEDILTGDVSRVLERYKAASAIKGEVVLMLNNRAEAEVDEASIVSELRIVLAESTLKDAVEIVSNNLGLSKKLVYKLGLQVKKEMER
jgi:16S rRNA (cytidine1402-2'-O)-methyltransferase